jgi:hypothetical protein
VRPRCPGPKDGGGPKLFKPEVLAGGGLVPGIEPLRPLAGIVFRCLEIAVLDTLAYLTAEAASLVVQRVPNGKNLAPKRPVGLDPQETFTKRGKTRNVKNSIGIQIVNLNPLSEKKITDTSPTYL